MSARRFALVVRAIAGRADGDERRPRLYGRMRRGVFTAPEAGLPPGYVPPSAALTPPETVRGSDGGSDGG
jgi:hypothetical protein